MVKVSVNALWMAAHLLAKALRSVRLIMAEGTNTHLFLENYICSLHNDS